MDSIIHYFSLSILFLGVCFQILARRMPHSFFSTRKKGMVLSLLMISIAGVLGYYAFLVFLQYMGWKNGAPPASFLVPPYRGIGYVYSYVFFRFLLYYVVSGIVAGIFFIVLRYINRMRGGIFFESDELFYASLAVFLLGFQEWNYLWIWYGIAIFLITFVASLLNPRIRKGEDRFPMYFLWLPLAIIAIIISEMVRVF